MAGFFIPRQKRWRKKRLRVLHREDHRCRYCHAPTTLPRTGETSGREDMATLDHVQPVCAGGKDTVDNTVLACWSCNRRKADGPMLTMKELLS